MWVSNASSEVIFSCWVFLLAGYLGNLQHVHFSYVLTSTNFVCNKFKFIPLNFGSSSADQGMVRRVDLGKEGLERVGQSRAEGKVGYGRVC